VRPGTRTWSSSTCVTVDRVVLTTDGVHAVVDPDRLRTLLSAGAPQETVDAVAAAVEEAGAPDNYAVVVADLG